MSAEVSLEIESISGTDSDYKYIADGRKERKENPENYGTLADIGWN